MLDNESFSPRCVYTENTTPDKYELHSKKASITEISSQFFNLRIGKFTIYLLSVLFLFSGLLLFICGLFGRHLFQFIIAFLFLIPGLILDNAREEYLDRR